MNCPKCGSTGVRQHNSNYPEKSLFLCLNVKCEHYFTEWQQAEIHAKEQEHSLCGDIIAEALAKNERLTFALYEQEQLEKELSAAKETIKGEREQYADLACKYEELEAKLAATKLKWQKGPPIGVGWFWILPFYDLKPIIVQIEKETRNALSYYWAGPILPPEEEK